VHRRGLGTEQAVDVIERLDDGAVFEEHDRVRHANGNHLKKGCSPNRLAIQPRSGQQAQGSGAMAQVCEYPGAVIGRVIRAFALDEVPFKIVAQVNRLGLVIGVVAGVQVRDANSV
jgi:hypothetical protein